MHVYSAFKKGREMIGKSGVENFYFNFSLSQKRQTIGQTFPKKLRKGEHRDFCQRIISKTKFVNQVYLNCKWH
jgi:hypothetical protein